MSKKVFLITGGCGFIGSALIRKLLLDDDNIVINIDKLTYASNQSSIENKENDNYVFYQADIINNNFLEEIFSKYEFDYVIHLAAESHVDRSIDSPESFIMTNILGTYHLLNNSYNYWKSISTKKRDSFRFLLVSTDEVYGSLEPNEEKFNEETQYRPNSPYAASKASADHLARSWYKTYNFPVIVTNTSNNYGNWQFPEKLIPLVISKCLSHKDIPIYGSGQQIRDWIHVDDHVDGLLFSIKKGLIGQKYNIGANNELTNLNVVNNICDILDKLKPLDGKNYSDLIKFVDDRPGHDVRYAIDSSKILKLGWKSNILWDKGIEETVIWYLNNLEFLGKNHTKDYKGERLGRI